MKLLHAAVIWINWILTKTQHATGRRGHHMSHGLQSAKEHRFNKSGCSFIMSEWLLQVNTDVQINDKNNYFLKEQNIYIPRGAVSSIRQLEILNSIQHGWSALFQSSRKCCWAKVLPNPPELCIVASCFPRYHKASVKQSRETSKPTSSLKSCRSVSNFHRCERGWISLCPKAKTSSLRNDCSSLILAAKV